MLPSRRQSSFPRDQLRCETSAPPRDHFVGNAGDSSLCCDPVTELMRVHFEEVPGAICKAEPLECGSDDRSFSLSPSSEKIVDGLLRQRFDQKSARLTLFMPEVP